MPGVRRDRTLNYTGWREPANVSPHRKSAICKPLEPGGERFADFLDGSLILVQTHALGASGQGLRRCRRDFLDFPSCPRECAGNRPRVGPG